MRKSKHSDEQIVAILKQVDTGTSITEVAREHNVSAQTIHRWREKFGGMQGADIKKMKILEDENARLKRMLSNMALENDAMKDFIQKKL